MKNPFEARDDEGSAIKHPNTVRFYKHSLLKPFSVTLIMITTKAEDVTYFDIESNLVIQAYLPAKAIVQANPNSSFAILVTNISTKEQHFNKRKLMGRLNDDLCTIVSSKTPQKSLQDE